MIMRFVIITIIMTACIFKGYAQSNDDDRQVVGVAEFSCKENNIENNKKIKATLEYEQFHSSDEWKKLSKLYKKLKMIRNSLAHAIDIGYKSSIDNLNYVKDFEKEFYIPIKEILNKNIDFKIFE